MSMIETSQKIILMKSNPLSKVVSIITCLIIFSSPVFSREDFRTDGAGQGNWQSVVAAISDTISVDPKSITFGEALEIIAGKGDFKLSYNRSRLPLEQIVTSVRTNAPAFEVLFLLLQQTETALILTSVGELAVVPSINSISNAATISGQVFDAETKKGRALS